MGNVTIVACNRSLGPTQPTALSGMVNEYQLGGTGSAFLAVKLLVSLAVYHIH